MTNHEKLQEDYENSLFALLMDEFAQSEGGRLMEENARLALDETAAVPRDIERCCLRLIERETSKRARSKSAAGFLHFLARMALAALIAIMLFGAAYALSPSLRAGTLNFLMQIDERAASWQFVTESEDSFASPTDLPKLTIGWMPEGFQLYDSSFDEHFAIISQYKNSTGGTITVSVFFNDISFYSIDIEDSDQGSDITIQGNPGIIVYKNGIIRISWVDITANAVLRIVSSDVDDTLLIKIAENVSVE